MLDNASEVVFLVAAVVTILVGYFSIRRRFPFVVRKRSTIKKLEALQGGPRQNGSTESGLESVMTADQRRWVWRRDTSIANMQKHNVSFFDIQGARIENTYTETRSQSELKKAQMKLEGRGLCWCIYYEGEGYNRVFELYPHPSAGDK
ncbi:MAG: hypothetical protein OXF50_10650 [Caldilineaceae bacterium]|nr:hypothetical protein [Caldilineaceae bacterium]